MKTVVADPADLQTKARESMARVRMSLEKMENVLLFQQERLQTIELEVSQFLEDVRCCHERAAKLKKVV